MYPDKAFILAAGLGSRLRPYTDLLPKPMVEIAGRSLILRTLDHLEEAGIKEVMINTHYRADQLIEHLKDHARPAINFSYEEELLNTGGGIKNALDFFDNNPFFVLSGDGLWNDGSQESALKRMSGFWDPGKMDMLLLLQPVRAMNLTTGGGDYHLDEGGRAVRAKDKSGAYMFTSIRINSPAVFDSTPDGAFSYLDLMDRAEESDRLYGIVHDAAWHHISTPHDLEKVNASYQKHRVGT